jgi:hypothetical protein
MVYKRQKERVFQVSSVEKLQIGVTLLLSVSEDKIKTDVEQGFLDEVTRGLKHHAPVLIDEGEGGSYFLRNDQGRLLAVFKPKNEDAFSTTNPKLQGRQPLEANRGVQAGETAIREVAAFLLDHENFVGIPLTLLVRVYHPYFQGPVEGSLQLFVPHDCASWDLGPGLFDLLDVQKIALLDLRFLNTDRHGGNILVRRDDSPLINPGKKCKLVAIDHGLCFPDSTLQYEDLYFEWENWPQAKQPFEPQIRKYIEDIDLWVEVNSLRNLGIREECVRVAVVCSTLVKVASSRGISPSAVAKLIRRVGSEVCFERLLPNINCPAVLSSLLFRISEWVDKSKTKGAFSCLPKKSGSHIQNPKLSKNLPIRPRYYRQNSAPMLVLLASK